MRQGRVEETLPSSRKWVTQERVEETLSSAPVAATQVGVEETLTGARQVARLVTLVRHHQARTQHPNGSIQ